MVRQIMITLLADEDKNDILAYWIKRNKSNVYSNKLNLLFNNAIDSIQENYLLGKRTMDDSVRYVTVSNYLIYYQFDEQFIYILRFWDGRQDFDKLNLFD
jgi:plasmid stabilization system protein ParE